MDKANLLILLNVYFGQTHRLAKDLGMDESVILNTLSFKERSNIKTEVSDKLYKNAMTDPSHKDFDLVLAFHLRQIPKQVDEVMAKKFYERMLLDKEEIVQFLKKNDSLVDKKSISIEEFKTMEQKIGVYSYIMNFICKQHLREHKVTADWDLSIRNYCNRLSRKIEVFNGNYVMQYSSLLDCYEIFDYKNFRYQVPSKSLYKIIKDILQQVDDPLELYLYYLGVNGSNEDREKLKRVWAFNFFLNDLEAKKITKKT